MDFISPISRINDISTLWKYSVGSATLIFIYSFAHKIILFPQPELVLLDFGLLFGYALTLFVFAGW